MSNRKPISIATAKAKPDSLHQRVMPRRCCESCKFWKRGDVNLREIGNAGNCTWMQPRTDGQYDHSKHAPFWAENHLRRTIGYEGEHCGVYEQASKKQIAANEKW